MRPRMVKLNGFGCFFMADPCVTEWGRCRGWLARRGHIEGYICHIKYHTLYILFYYCIFSHYSRKPCGRGFPFSDPPGCGGKPPLYERRSRAGSGGSCFVSQKPCNGECHLRIIYARWPILRARTVKLDCF